MEKITIQTEINAEMTNVWKSYTSAEHIVNWNFANDDWCCPSAKTELHVGGKYVARMEAKDGSFGFDFEAIYTEIIPEELLSYKLADERKVDVKFSKLDDSKIKVEVNFDAENENPIDLQRAGWQAILTNFKTYCEKTI